MDVLFYDRCQQGAKRLYRNRDALSDGLNGKLAISWETVCRREATARDVGIGTLLLADDFPYGAALINGAGAEAEGVLNDMLEMEKISSSRVIYLCEGGTREDLTEQGIRCVQIYGGNGCLNERDVKAIVAAISEVNQEITASA